MISFEMWLTYTMACIFIILSPGPDNILAVSRGLSQGRLAAIVSSMGAGLGLMVHVLAAALGLAVIVKNSAPAFFVVKVVGAAYLIWLGLRVLKSRDLISFSSERPLPLRSVFVSVLHDMPPLFGRSSFTCSSRASCESNVLRGP